MIEIFYSIFHFSIKMAKIFVVGIIILFAASMVYQYLGHDSELYFIHQIPKGSVNITTDFHQSEFGNIKITKNNSNLSIFYMSKLIIGGHENQKAPAFLILSKNAHISIDSFGDSFYKIQHDISSYCTHQIISKFDARNNQILMTGSFSDCLNSQFELKIQQKQARLEAVVTVKDKSFNRALLRFAHSSSNHYYGLGQQFSFLDLGLNRPYSMLVREKGVGRNDQPQTSIANFLHNAGGTYYSTYCPMPIWYSSQNIAYILDSVDDKALSKYSYSAWMNNELFIALDTEEENSFSVTILASNETGPKKLIKGIGQINGYSSRVPEWINQGAILGLQGGTKAVIQKYNKLKQAGAIIRGLWLQDWVSKRWSLGYSRLWWNWELDDQHYPNWNEMRAELNKNKVQLLAYINPMFVDASTKAYKKVNYYQQLKNNNHFIKLNNGENFATSAFSDFRASMVDFDNPQAKKYYQDLVRKIIKQTQVKGMMVDFSEAYPVYGKHSSPEQAMKYHNRYPVIYHEAVREVLDEFSSIYTFTRAGFTGTPKYAQSLWAGDQNMNFRKNTGLRSCLIAMLSSGLTGYSNTHCDIGGYTFVGSLNLSVRTKTLMTRWMQLSAFSPVFRTHEGNSPEKTIQVFSDDEIAQQFALYSNVFNILSEYRSDEWQKCEEQKIPLVRPLFVELGFKSERIMKIDDQFYLGEQILVCPIISKANHRSYFLPEGQWINIWTQENEKVEKGEDGGIEKTYEGNLMPVFIKKQSKFAESILKNIRQLLKRYDNVIRQYSSRNQKGYFDL